MSLAPNSRLGPYEIKSPLGVGGMGEVYRARDSRLNRDVAIKILLSEGTESADLRSRFEREARAVAALNHPNIVAVYDFGIEGNQQYIVSELIEGESLRALMRGKAVPGRRLVDIASQVADGLAAAHAAGIVHRDLKPENIMIAKDGRVKILDFGLARQARPAGILAVGSGDETIASIPEANRNLTGEGTVMGTPGYMSPEQALGRELDYHSDQFSFGLILYELASGKQAFAKASGIETMAAIIRDEPAPMDEKVPPPLRWIIDRCLAKEPEQRYESTRDLYRDLKNLRDHFSEAYTSGAFPQAAAPAAKRSYTKVAAVCIVCMVLTALAVYVLKPAGQNIGDLRYTPFATNAEAGVWSLDGKSVAYLSSVNGIQQVFIKYLHSAASVQLTHEQKDASLLGWTGDGSHLLVTEADDKNANDEMILSFATVGGEPDLIMKAACSTCTVSPDGKVLANFDQAKRTLQISDPIGSPFVPYKLNLSSEKEIYGEPRLEFSLDGKSILLMFNSGGKNQKAWRLPYPGGKESPRAVLHALASLEDTPRVAWMPDNRHLVVSMTTDPGGDTSHLWMADTQSEAIFPLTNGIYAERHPQVSPDGRSLLFTHPHTSFDVVSLSLDNGTPTTLISTGHGESSGSWSAQKQKFVWVTDRNGSSEIWLRSADGSDRPLITAIDFPDRLVWNPSLSPDGNRMIFAMDDDSGSTKLWIVSLAGGAPIRLTNMQSGSEFGGAWSPDGGRFAYVTAESGGSGLMTAKTNGGATPVLLRQGFLGLPSWSPQGDWITCKDATQGWFLVSPDGKSVKPLGKFLTDHLAFSKDGKLLYGMLGQDQKTGQKIATLFSLDPATLKQKVIRELGADYQPTATVTPGVSFSMAPDGKSFLYTTMKRTADLWMLQGFKQPSWLDRFAHR